MLLKVYAYPSSGGHQFYRRAGLCFALGTTVEIDASEEMAAELRASGRLLVEVVEPTEDADAPKAEKPKGNKRKSPDEKPTE